jgi:hypothetical protein
VSGGGKTHTEQLKTGHIDILSHFVCTFELAPYTILLLTYGSPNHGRCSTLGQGGGSMCHANKKIRWGGAPND